MLISKNEKLLTTFIVFIVSIITILILFGVFNNLNTEIIIKELPAEQYTICHINNKFDVSYDIKTNEVISITLDKDHQNNICTNKSIEKFLNLNQ
jgi:hypothetical protein